MSDNLFIDYFMGKLIYFPISLEFLLKAWYNIFRITGFSPVAVKERGKFERQIFQTEFCDHVKITALL